MVKKKKSTKTYQKMKKAFTLIELIFVVIVIVALMAIAIGKIINNSKSAKLGNVVNNDISQIVKAANKWRSNDAASDGTFENLTTASLCPYLPNNMQCDSNGIYSSGFHDASGKGRITYQITSDKLNTAGDSFKIFANASGLASAQHWQNRLKQKFEAIADNDMKKASNQPNNVSIDQKAQGLGNKDSAFSPDNGNTKDAQTGVRYIIQ